MPQIVYSQLANSDLVRLAHFALSISPDKVEKSLKAITLGISRLKDFPEIAAPSKIEKYQNLRELFIPFGKNGYCVLYEYHPQSDTVLINAIRHSLECGYAEKSEASEPQGF
ncbi:MAG: type II toxin-antitoxin system RelE/ParE family toxin [Gallionella sp.]|nr:type II toxin-antitoxin system RelE/ParE family toxin [Gallionella sp.]MDD4958793.1 type II toxin-antitoxin system RelE/ParE family toxin [Gallionella sp.]